MSKEIGYFARNYGRDRAELKAFAEKVLPPEHIKVTKGLLWISDDGIPLLEAALNNPESPAKVEPEVITVFIARGAKNPRFEFGRLPDGTKVGVLIPSRMKDRYINRNMRVEVITNNDGAKIYRLLCHKFQSITS